MAGLSGKQVIVDVVAASEQLVPSKAPELPTEVPEVLEPAVIAPTELEAPPRTCALGHLNTEEARFCTSCGLPMDARNVRLPGPQPSARPKPEHELTREELAERDRQHQQAVAAAAQFERQQPDYRPTEGEAVLIHFVADGLTAMGQVWYRGQELEIGPDHPRWPEVRGWITLSRFEQIDRWGAQKFDFGPWPGRRSYTEAAGSFEQLVIGNGDNAAAYAGPSAEELAAADEAERRRGRAAPAPAFW